MFSAIGRTKRGVIGLASLWRGHRASSPPAPTVLFYDTFTGTTGTLLTARSPDVDTVGGGWVNSSGTYVIKSNMAASLTGVSMVHADVGVNQYTISAIQMVNNGAFYSSIVFRYADINNYWICYLHHSDQRMYIFEVAAGVFISRASLSRSILPETNYQAVISIVGNTVTYTIDGISSLSYVMTSSTSATHVGLRGNTSGAFSGYVDTFRVESL